MHPALFTWCSLCQVLQWTPHQSTNLDSLINLYFRKIVVQTLVIQSNNYNKSLLSFYSAKICEDKLRYASYNCVDMDADVNYMDDQIM